MFSPARPSTNPLDTSHSQSHVTSDSDCQSWSRAPPAVHDQIMVQMVSGTAPRRGRWIGRAGRWSPRSGGERNLEREWEWRRKARTGTLSPGPVSLTNSWAKKWRCYSIQSPPISKSAMFLESSQHLPVCTSDKDNM
jgi:hypothetical protein